MGFELSATECGTQKIFRDALLVEFVGNKKIVRRYQPSPFEVMTLHAFVVFVFMVGLSKWNQPCAHGGVPYE